MTAAYRILPNWDPCSVLLNALPINYQQHKQTLRPEFGACMLQSLCLLVADTYREPVTAEYCIVHEIIAA